MAVDIILSSLENVSCSASACFLAWGSAYEEAVTKKEGEAAAASLARSLK